MNTPEVLVLFGLVATLIIVIIVAYAWSHVTVRQAKDVTEQIESLTDNRRRRSREILDKLNEVKQQIAQNQTIVQSLITARDEARQRLAFMETKYKTMYENAGIGIARLDATYQYIEVNRYYAQIYGYDSPDEFLKNNPSFANVCSYFQNDSTHREWHNTTSMLKNDCHHRTKTGEEIVVQNTFVPVVNDFGVIEFYDLFAENVTEEARIRQELEQSNVRLDAEARKRAEKIITMEREHARLYNTAPVGLYRAELKDGAFIFVNEYMAHMLGYKTIEDCLLHSMAEHYLDASDHDRFIIPFNESADTPTHRVTVCWKKAKSEHRVWLILTEVINFQQGYVEGVAVDVSNETIAQQELIRAKEQYRLVYERAPVGLYQIDAITGSFEMINNTMREILGYNSMMPTSDINMNEHIVSSLGEKRPISNQTVTYETEIITSSGETKWLGLTEILCENDSVYEGFAIDITKQKIAEQQVMISLRDSGEAKRLKGLCESVLSAFGALIRYTRKDDALKQSVDELVGRFDILAGTVSMIESDGNMATIYACGPQHDMEQAILQATNMMGGKMPIFQTVISGRQYLLFILRENNRFVGVLGFIMSDLWIPFSTDRIDDQELLSYYAESLTTFLTHRT